MYDNYFDLFRGTEDKIEVWLEVIPGLESAIKRMEQIAAKTPGKYFVFSTAQQAVLAHLDNADRRTTG